jgi:hypothetical protein
VCIDNVGVDAAAGKGNTNMVAKMTSYGLVSLTAFLMAGCATTPQVPTQTGSVDPMTTGTGSGRVSATFVMGDLARTMGLPSLDKSRAEVATVARRADVHPLGSKENPVRARRPEGQRAYIARLRCPSGDAPRIKDRFNIGPGIYGTIVDSYTLTCNGQADKRIMLDMYHDWIENRPAAGFTIVTSGSSLST